MATNNIVDDYFEVSSCGSSEYSFISHPDEIDKSFDTLDDCGEDLKLDGPKDDNVVLEDICHFVNMLLEYDINKDILVNFTINSGSACFPTDRIALFQVSFTSPEQYLSYEWIPTDPLFRHNMIYLIFPVIKIPKDTEATYQFCYIDRLQRKRGVSSKFKLFDGNNASHPGTSCSYINPIAPPTPGTVDETIQRNDLANSMRAHIVEQEDAEEKSKPKEEPISAEEKIIRQLKEDNYVLLMDIQNGKKNSTKLNDQLKAAYGELEKFESKFQAMIISLTDETDKVTDRETIIKRLESEMETIRNAGTKTSLKFAGLTLEKQNVETQLRKVNEELKQRIKSEEDLQTKICELTEQLKNLEAEQISSTEYLSRMKVDNQEMKNETKVFVERFFEVTKCLSITESEVLELENYKTNLHEELTVQLEENKKLSENLVESATEIIRLEVVIADGIELAADLRKQVAIKQEEFNLSEERKAVLDSDVCTFKDQINNLQKTLRGVHPAALQCNPKLDFIGDLQTELPEWAMFLMKENEDHEHLSNEFEVLANEIEEDLTVRKEDLTVSEEDLDEDDFIYDQEFLAVMQARAEEQNILAEEQGVLSEEQEDLAEEQEVLAEEQEVLAEEQEVLAEEQEVLAEEQEVLAEEQEDLAEELEDLAEEQQVLAEEQQVLAEEQQVIAEEQQIIAEEQQVIAEEEQEIIAEEQEIIAEEQEIIAEEQEILAEEQEFHGEAQDIRVEEQEFYAKAQVFLRAKVKKVHAKVQEILAEEQEILAEEQEFHGEAQDIRVEEQEVHAKEQEVHAKEQEVHAKVQEVHANVQEVHAMMQEVHAKMQEVHAEEPKGAYGGLPKTDHSYAQRPVRDGFALSCFGCKSDHRSVDECHTSQMSSKSDLTAPVFMPLFDPQPASNGKENVDVLPDPLQPNLTDIAKRAAVAGANTFLNSFTTAWQALTPALSDSSWENVSRGTTPWDNTPAETSLNEVIRTTTWDNTSTEATRSDESTRENTTREEEGEQPTRPVSPNTTSGSYIATAPSYTNLSSMVSSVENVMGAEALSTTYHCPYCSKKLNSDYEEFVKHIKEVHNFSFEDIHTIQRPDDITDASVLEVPVQKDLTEYNCPICTMKFALSSERLFTQHVESHLENCCPMCGDLFDRTVKMKVFERHVQAHFEENDADSITVDPDSWIFSNDGSSQRGNVRFPEID